MIGSFAVVVLLDSLNRSRIHMETAKTKKEREMWQQIHKNTLDVLDPTRCKCECSRCHR